MKKYFFIFICTMMSACNDIPSSDMIGKWQLRTMDKNGTVTEVDTVWYNFQSESLFSIQIYDKQSDYYSYTNGFKTQPAENKMHIELFNCYDWSLPIIDWPDSVRNFTIDKQNDKELILRSDEGWIYTFKKF